MISAQNAMKQFFELLVVALQAAQQYAVVVGQCEEGPRQPSRPATATRNSPRPLS